MLKETCEPANLVFDLMGVIFDYETQSDGSRRYYTLEDGVEILRACAKQTNSKGQPLHSLFILSNCSLKAFQTIQSQHPEVLNLFQGRIISGEVDLQKPDPAIFKLLIIQHRLNYQRTIFIDDNFENIQAADQHGLISLHYQNPNLVRQTLKVLQVLP
jgi:2-haloacid dehalogenase